MSEVPHTFYSPGLEMIMKYAEWAPMGQDPVPASEFRLVSGLPFSLYTLDGSNQQEGHAVVVVAGSWEDLAEIPEGPLVRMHSACVFSEVGDSPIFQKWLEQDGLQASDGMVIASRVTPSTECDCKAQRETAQPRIASEGGVYFDLVEQEGRGAGLEVKRRAYQLQAEEGLDTVEAYERMGVPFDTREYGHCARFLLEHGIRQIQLMSNNPRKIAALSLAGLEVTPVPLVAGVSVHNIGYLKTKRDKGEHSLPADSELTELLLDNGDSL